MRPAGRASRSRTTPCRRPSRERASCSGGARSQQADLDSGTADHPFDLPLQMDVAFYRRLPRGLQPSGRSSRGFASGCWVRLWCRAERARTVGRLPAESDARGPGRCGPSATLSNLPGRPSPADLRDRRPHQHPWRPPTVHRDDRESGRRRAPSAMLASLGPAQIRKQKVNARISAAILDEVRDWSSPCPAHRIGLFSDLR